MEQPSPGLVEALAEVLADLHAVDRRRRHGTLEAEESTRARAAAFLHSSHLAYRAAVIHATDALSSGAGLDCDNRPAPPPGETALERMLECEELCAACLPRARREIKHVIAVLTGDVIAAADAPRRFGTIALLSAVPESESLPLSERLQAIEAALHDLGHGRPNQPLLRLAALLRSSAEHARELRLRQAAGGIRFVDPDPKHFRGRTMTETTDPVHAVLDCRTLCVLCTGRAIGAVRKLGLGVVETPRGKPAAPAPAWQLDEVDQGLVNALREAGRAMRIGDWWKLVPRGTPNHRAGAGRERVKRLVKRGLVRSIGSGSATRYEAVLDSSARIATTPDDSEDACA